MGLGHGDGLGRLLPLIYFVRRTKASRISGRDDDRLYAYPHCLWMTSNPYARGSVRRPIEAEGGSNGETRYSPIPQSKAGRQKRR
jgi:hypothetical protein